jgi:endonuclease/exonuclease/phosphatase family metal-dependent hydrolase
VDAGGELEPLVALQPVVRAPQRHRRRAAADSPRCLRAAGGVGRSAGEPRHLHRRRARHVSRLCRLPAPGKWQHKIGDASGGIGNADLSRWPISESDVGRLPVGDEPGEGRLVLYARIDTLYGNVPFFVTHLNSAWGQSGPRQEQVVAEFMRQKDQDGYPPILTGDLNAPPDADDVRCLVGKAPPSLRGLVLGDAWAYARPLSPGRMWDRRNPHVAATFEPDTRIDYVFVGLPDSSGQGQVLDAELVGTERRTELASLFETQVPAAVVLGATVPCRPPSLTR